MLECFFFPGGSRGEFKNCLRLNYGHPFDARIEEALATLGRLLKASAG